MSQNGKTQSWFRTRMNSNYKDDVYEQSERKLSLGLGRDPGKSCRQTSFIEIALLKTLLGHGHAYPLKIYEQYRKRAL